MTIEEILAATDALPNETEIPIGDQKIKLGDIRSLTAKEMQKISAKQRELDQKTGEMTNTAIQAAQALAAIQEIRTGLETQKTTTKTSQQEADDFDTAEWWKPVRERFSARDKKIDEAIGKLDKMEKSIQQASWIWFKDRSRQQFKELAPRLKKVKGYEDWDENKVIEYAAKNKFLDENELPSVEKAIAELTKATEIEVIKKEAYEQGLKEGRTKARMADMPRPSSATGGKVPKGKSAVEEVGLEGLGDDVMNDDEIMQKLAQLKDIEGDILQ